jgi:hypothetical protein
MKRIIPLFLLLETLSMSGLAAKTYSISGTISPSASGVGSHTGRGVQRDCNCRFHRKVHFLRIS